MMQILSVPAASLSRRADQPLPTGAALDELIEELEATMRAARGIGIAAPQVGLSIPLALIAPPALPHPIVLLDPQVISSDGAQRQREGCLSLPALTGVVTRPSEMRLRTLTRDGEWITLELRAELARIASHEIDHLVGRLYLKRAEAESILVSGR